MALGEDGAVFNQLPKIIQQEITRRLDGAVNEEFERAKERIEKRKGEIIAGVMVDLERMVRVETRGQELVISVVLEKK